MPTLEALAFIAVGFGIGIAYIRLMELRTNSEQPSHNELQRAVYEPKDAPRPVAHVHPETPVKRGPGRPRKTPVDSEQTVQGGKRYTRTYAQPLPGAKPANRRRVN